MDNKRTIFITGIAGFIGFHVASFLIKNGDYVIGCDNFNNYYSPELKIKRKKHLEYLGVEVLSEDIQTLQSIPPNTTHIIHLAAQAGVRYSLENPFAYADSNLTGFISILELAKTVPNVKLIFASSSSVYGANTKVPFSETDPNEDPISLYAATKKSGELLAKSYHHLFHIPMIGLRFFTVYGPWGRPDMAYFSFAEKILSKTPIPVFNHGEMERDFTYIDDIVKGVASSLDHCEGFEIYNLGNHKVESLMRLISLLEETLGEKAILDFKPMQKGDVKTTFADIEKAKKDLGFCPTTSLEDGIKHFSKWFLDSYVAKV